MFNNLNWTLHCNLQLWKSFTNYQHHLIIQTTNANSSWIVINAEVHKSVQTRTATFSSCALLSRCFFFFVVPPLPFFSIFNGAQHKAPSLHCRLDERRFNVKVSRFRTHMIHCHSIFSVSQFFCRGPNAVMNVKTPPAANFDDAIIDETLEGLIWSVPLEFTNVCLESARYLPKSLNYVHFFHTLEIKISFKWMKSKLNCKTKICRYW